MSSAVGLCPSDVIVPVVFMPGIMGSRLESNGRVVWDPDDKMLMLSLYGRNAGTVVGPDPFGTRERDNVRQAAARRKAMLVGNRFNRDFLKPVEFKRVEGLTPNAPIRRRS